jgi:multidrug efflux pump subunit AcrB
MKKIISYFIKFPVAVNVIIFAFLKLISINLIYPGASPAEMEEGVVLKIEDNLKGIVGVERVTSISQENSARISVETIRGKNIDVVLADVKNAVDRVPSFPSGMEPPIIAKVETTRPTISFTLSGDNIPLRTLKHISSFNFWFPR